MIKQIKITRILFVLMMVLFFNGQASAIMTAVSPTNTQKEQVVKGKNNKKAKITSKKKPKLKEKKNRKGFWKIVGGSILNTLGGVYLGWALTFLALNPLGSGIYFLFGAGMLVWGTFTLMKGIRKHIAEQDKVNARS